MEKFETSFRYQKKNFQSKEENVAVHAIRLKSLENEISQIQDEVIRAAYDAKEAAEKNLKDLWGEISTCQKHD